MYKARILNAIKTGIDVVVFLMEGESFKKKESKELYMIMQITVLIQCCKESRLLGPQEPHIIGEQRK